MSNNVTRTVDHKTAVFSQELATDAYGLVSPKTVTVEGLEFHLGEDGYVNQELGLFLYLEGKESIRTAADVSYAEVEPLD